MKRKRSKKKPKGKEPLTPRPLPQYDVKTEISEPPTHEAALVSTGTVPPTVEMPHLPADQAEQPTEPPLPRRARPRRPVPTIPDAIDGLPVETTLEDAFASPIADDVEMKTMPDAGLSDRLQRRVAEEARAQLEAEAAGDEQSPERDAATRVDGAPEPGSGAGEDDDPWSYFPATVADDSGRPPSQPGPMAEADVATRIEGGEPRDDSADTDAAEGSGPGRGDLSTVVTLVSRPEPDESPPATFGDEGGEDETTVHAERPRASPRVKRVALPKQVQAVAAPPTGPPQEGIPFGPYWLFRRLKSGGMAEVYEARSQGSTGHVRTVAIKRIQLPLTESEEFVNMFMDEAKITVLLDHPNIVQVQEFGQVGHQYYIAMEYVHGRDFDSVLQHTSGSGARIPISTAIYVVQQILEGLDYAHSKQDARGRSFGIVHRDVSPANILCGFDGLVKLTDFGIAKAAVKVSLTRPGIILGKLSYMSPEQIQATRIDHRSDIYAAGVVLWEALTGRSLFRGDNDAVTIRNVLRAEVPPLRSLRPDAPAALSDLVQQALSREPARRPHRASEMSAELQKVYAQLGATKPQNDFIVFMAALFEGAPAGEPIFKRKH